MIRLSVCFCALLLAVLTSTAPAGHSSVPASSGVSTASVLPSSSAPEPSAAPTSIVVPSATVSSGGTATDSAPPEFETVPGISLNPNFQLWNESTTTTPEGIRGSLGATVIGPTSDELIDKQNADLLAPPSTDHGSVPNSKWPFSLSHNRLQTGGWAREQNTDEMPVATQMSGVNMRLEAGAIREMHWHKTAEWAYVLKGTTQVSSVDQNGRNYVARVNAGDLWYFPAGIPHVLQATDDDPDGSEFLLVFDQGDFSEDETFLVTDWMAHVPAEVLAKNFQVDIDTFKNVPSDQLYIFPASPPANDDAPSDPQGTVPEPFTFAFSKVTPTQLSGGTVKIADSSTFKISEAITVAEVTVEPGAMRELHWHPTQDEWSFFLEGNGRMTIFASQSNARTFDYQTGDIGYVAASMGHYVENTGNTTLRYLEIFHDDKFQDISLNQWLALTPPEVVKAHLGFSDETIAKLTKKKQTVVGPA